MVNFGGISGEQLRGIVSKIEKLEQQKSEIQSYIADVYSEAKSSGFDVKVIRQIISMRKKRQEELEEMQEILDLYMHALGMIVETENKEEDL